MGTVSVFTHVGAAAIILSALVKISACAVISQEVVSIVTGACMTGLLVMAQLGTATIRLGTLIHIHTASLQTESVCCHPRLALTKPGAWGVQAHLSLATATIVQLALVIVFTRGVSCAVVALPAGALMASWQIGAYLVTTTIVVAALVTVRTERLVFSIGQEARIAPALSCTW